MSVIGCSIHTNSQFCGLLRQNNQTKLLCFECMTELTPSEQMKVISLKKAIQMPIYLQAQFEGLEKNRLNFFSQFTDAQINKETENFIGYLNLLQKLLNDMKNQAQQYAEYFIQLRKDFESRFLYKDQLKVIQEKMQLLLNFQQSDIDFQFDKKTFENEINQLLSDYQTKNPLFYQQIEIELDTIQNKMGEIIQFKTSQEIVQQMTYFRQSYVSFTNKFYFEEKLKKISLILRENIFLDKITKFILQGEAKKQLNLSLLTTLTDYKDNQKKIFEKAPGLKLNILETNSGIIFGFCSWSPEKEINFPKPINIFSTNSTFPKIRPFIFSLKNDKWYEFKTEINQLNAIHVGQSTLQLGSDLQIDQNLKVQTNLGQSYGNFEDIYQSKNSFLGCESDQITKWEIFSINISAENQQNLASPFLFPNSIGPTGIFGSGQSLFKNI